MADIRSVHALMQDYQRHLAHLEELRGLLRERLEVARSAGGRSAGRAVRLIAEIEAAIERMDSGRYGTCLRCGTFIALDQLRNAPHRQECVECGNRAAA
ncbi:hypothetical protein [Nonomuraea sp. NPDC046570]|uniref:TraR/DksA family transcriptional regulator n=1 Tax=Nonomuraea sp. NPDC046570 TaxID=3155255 RepID=UPI0033DC855B